MKMLGGTYGEGTITYLSYDRSLQIIAKNAWLPKTRKISEITNFEDVNNQTSGSLGKAGIGAAAGFLLAGPLAGVIGMAMGASGGTSTQFVFGIGFSNGDAIMIAAKSKDYMELKSVITPYLPKPKVTKNKIDTKQNIKKKKSKKPSSKPTLIEDRNKKKAPNTKTKLALEISERLDNSKENSDEQIFYKSIEKYIVAVNHHKWSYFDKFLNDDDVAECIILAYAEAYNSEDKFRYSVKSDEKFINDTLISSLKMYEEELGKFWSNLGSKAELRKNIEERKRDISDYEGYVKDNQKSAENLKRQLPIFEAITTSLVDPAVFSARVVNYKIRRKDDFFGPDVFKIDGTLTKNFGLKFFKNRVEKENQIIPNPKKVEVLHTSSNPIETRLQKLSDLLEKKLITKKEFNEKKKEILNEL